MAKVAAPQPPAMKFAEFPPVITGESRLAWSYLARLHVAVHSNDQTKTEQEGWLKLDSVGSHLVADILMDMARDTRLKLAELTDLFGTTIARLDLGARPEAVPTFRVSDGRPQIALWVLVAAVRYLHDHGGVVASYSELVSAVLKRLMSRMHGFKTCEFALRHEEEGRMIRFAVVVPSPESNESTRLEYSRPRWEAGALFHPECCFHAFAITTGLDGGQCAKTICIRRVHPDNAIRTYAVELIFDKEPSKTSHTPRRLLACAFAHVLPASALAMRAYASNEKDESSAPTRLKLWLERETPEATASVVYQPENDPLPYWVEQMMEVAPVGWYSDPLGVMTRRMRRFQPTVDAVRSALGLIAQLEREP